MQKLDYANTSLLSLVVAWAAHRIRAMRPKYTSGEIARVTALSGNPPGA